MALEEIRAALAGALQDVPELAQSAYLKPGANPPSAEIEPGPIDYDLAFGRGLDQYTLIVRVEVPFSSDIGAQKRLDRMMEPSGEYSIKAALEADGELGGACDSLRVTKCDGYKTFIREGRPATLGAEWTVLVFADGR